MTPVGGGSPIPVDVRVVAATHRDLEAMIADGGFREDLFYRLDVVSIEIPPLRARREDIPALAEHFRREVNAREGRSVPGFALDVMQRLARYDWPGNVRELENFVERAVVIAGTRMVAMQGPPHRTCAPQVLDLERAARDLPMHGVDLPPAADGDRGAPDHRGARTRRRQPRPRRRAAAIEPHHTCREAAPEERRLAISAHILRR